MAKARSWMNHHLSYAGRLLNFILFSIQVYWSYLFNVSRVIIEKITSLLRSFLCKGSDLLMVMQKLLGILSVCLRRKGVWVSKILKCGTGAAMVKHLWSSCNPAKSIWSSWISFYLLHGRSFWEIPWSGNCSWSKRKILGFRGVVRKFIYF
jgi:hypothetical protein